jgi:hypothetical protein
MLQQSEQGTILDILDDATDITQNLVDRRYQSAGDEAEGSRPVSSVLASKVSIISLVLCGNSVGLCIYPNILVHNNLQPDHLR